MADSKIEWTDKVWNPVTGCSKVSQGCKNCYAERLWPKVSAAEAVRTGRPARAFTDVRCHPERLEYPLRWRKPARIFVNSMSDLFHESVPDDFIECVFTIMAMSQQHTFQILTKRPERMQKFMSHDMRHGWVYWAAWQDYKIPKPDKNTFPSWPLPNVWLGVSVEDQVTANERIPLLLQTPAAVRFISAEPLLGPIDLGTLLPGPINSWFPWIDDIDWVITGGESGHNARPAHPDWFRLLRDQCNAAGVPFFFKQHGEWVHISQFKKGMPSAKEDHFYFTTNSANPDAAAFFMVGKKAAGRLLDGVEHNGMPV